jgi:hypothetical protein
VETGTSWNIVLIILTILSTLLFVSDNNAFFIESDLQTKAGAEWKYVGKTKADRMAEQLFTFPSEKGLKTILFKLKMPVEGKN